MLCEVLTAPSAETAILEDCSEVQVDGPSALDRLFRSAVGFSLPQNLLVDLGFLYIKLILQPRFKTAFTRRFVLSYDALFEAMTQSRGAEGQQSQCSQFFDLLSCQLFHDEEAVLSLVSSAETRLLHRLLSRLQLLMAEASAPRRRRRPPPERVSESDSEGDSEGDEPLERQEQQDQQEDEATAEGGGGLLASITRSFKKQKKATTTSTTSTTTTTTSAASAENAAAAAAEGGAGEGTLICGAL